jgi:hypothetical protein
MDITLILDKVTRQEKLSEEEKVAFLQAAAAGMLALKNSNPSLYVQILEEATRRMEETTVKLGELSASLDVKS